MQFESKISDVKKINPMFSECKIRVMYAGENRNNSIIPKEVVEANLHTIYNTPIIGEFIKDKNDFGGHGGKTKITDDGIKFIRTTMPYGVIPSNAEVYWEDVKESDGTMHEYLTVNKAILWTGRYEEANRIIDEGNGQSMEINVSGGKFNEDKKYMIEEFSFSGLCILGLDVTPAFESASITAYSLDKDEFKKEFNQMLEELKFSLGDSMEYESKKHIDINNTKAAANMTGSWSSVDKTDLRHKLTSASNAKSLVEEGYLIVDSDWKHAPSEALHYPHHEVKDDTLIVHKAGLEAAYARLMQNDPHNEKALAHVKRHYRELGLDMSSFEINEGGNDMDEKEFERVMAENANLQKDLESEREKVEKFEVELKEAKDNIAEFEQKLGEMKAEFDKLNNEKQELEEYKLKVEKEAKEKAVEEVFESVKDSLGEDELAPYKEKAMDMDVEVLKTELFALIGRKAFSANKEQGATHNFQMNIQEFNRSEVKSGKGYEHIIEKYTK